MGWGSPLGSREGTRLRDPESFPCSDSEHLASWGGLSGRSRVRASAVWPRFRCVSFRRAARQSACPCACYVLGSFSHAPQGIEQRPLCCHCIASPSRGWQRPPRFAPLPVDLVTLAEEEGSSARGDRRDLASYFFGGQLLKHVNLSFHVC